MHTSVKRKVVIPALAEIGTLNPEALQDEQFQHRSMYPVFEEASALSSTVASLKAEHEQLIQELQDLISSSEQTKYTKFKRNTLTFERKLAERALELENFSKHLNSYRSDSFPTFVEVDALNTRHTKPSFDAVNASLLVSNQQRSFFASDFMSQKNEELKELIAEQEQALRMLDARLKLFSSYEKASTVEFTVSSLKNGVFPSLLTNTTPTAMDELSTKQKALSNELATLVKERKSLVKRRIAAKLVRRRRRERVKKIMQKQQETEVSGELSRKELAEDDFPGRNENNKEETNEIDEEVSKNDIEKKHHPSENEDDAQEEEKETEVHDEVSKNDIERKHHPSENEDNVQEEEKETEFDDEVSKNDSEEKHPQSENAEDERVGDDLIENEKDDQASGTETENLPQDKPVEENAGNGKAD